MYIILYNKSKHVKKREKNKCICFSISHKKQYQPISIFPDTSPWSSKTFPFLQGFSWILEREIPCELHDDLPNKMSKMDGYQLTRFDTHHPLVSRNARRTGRLIREKWSDTLEREWNAGKEWRLLRPGPLKVWDDPMRWPALLRLTWHRSANWSSGENKAERERERMPEIPLKSVLLSQLHNDISASTWARCIHAKRAKMFLAL